MNSLLTMCSSWQRSARLVDTIKSWSDTTMTKDAKFVIYVYEKDPQLTAYKKIEIKDPRISIEYGKQRSMVGVLNYYCVEKYPDYEYYSEVNDDHVYITPGWDLLMMDAIDRKNNGVAVAYGKTEGFPTATMHGGKLIRALGYFFPPAYLHTYVDLWLEELQKGVDLLTYVREAWVDHRHPVFKKAKWDSTYRVSSDTEIPADKITHEKWIEEQRDEDVGHLKAMIEDSRVLQGDKPIGRIKDKIAVLMTTYDRLELLKRTIESMLCSGNRPRQIFVFDDGSKKLEEVKNVCLKVPEIVFIKNSKNYGSDGNILHAQRVLFEAGAEHILALDSDCLFAPNWYKRSMEICDYLKMDNIIMCLFNARVHPARPCPIGGFVEKQYIGGLGFLISKETWAKYVVPKEKEKDLGGWDGTVCTRAAKDGYKIMATSPSMLQHTGGAIGVHSSIDAVECIADDFEGDGIGKVTLPEFSRALIKTVSMNSERVQKLLKCGLPADFGPDYPGFNQPSYQNKWKLFLKDISD